MKTDKPTTLKDLMKWNKSNISFQGSSSAGALSASDACTQAKPTPPKPKPPATKVWVIDPESQSIELRDEPNIQLLISEIVGERAECLKLDNNDNVVWLTDAPNNPRFAWFFEGMNSPFCDKHYNRGLIISLNGDWDENVISDWLRWYDRQNIWGDL